MIERHRRSRAEIYLELMKNCIEPILPTKLMYAGNLSYKVLKQYLVKMIEHGYIVAVDVSNDCRSKCKYVITAKGLTLIHDYDAWHTRVSV